jgi:hypothetical protein
MVEVLVASAFVAGGVMAAARLGQPIHARRLDPMVQSVAMFGDDLPCPWCSAATSERDSRCPSCHQRFG